MNNHNSINEVREQNEILNCRICHSFNIHYVVGAESGRWLIQEDTPIRKQISVKIGVCHECGHGQVLNKLSNQQIADMYANPTDHSPGKLEPCQRNPTDCLPENSQILQKHLNENTRVADIGCGPGNLLRSIYDWAGMDVQNLLGVDFIDSRNWDFPHSVIDINNQNEMVKLSSQTGLFDLVSITNVVEHLQNPYETLTGLRNLLSPDGLIYVEVPDCAESDQLDRLLSTPLVHPHHLHYFTNDTIITVLKKSGYSLVDYRLYNYRDWRSQQLLCRKINHASTAGTYLHAARDSFEQYDTMLLDLIKLQVKEHDIVGLWGCGSEVVRLYDNSSDFRDWLNTGTVVLIDGQLARKKVFDVSCVDLSEFLSRYDHQPIIISVHYSETRESMLKYARALDCLDRTKMVSLTSTVPN